MIEFSSASTNSPTTPKPPDPAVPAARDDVRQTVILLGASDSSPRYAEGQADSQES